MRTVRVTRSWLVPVEAEFGDTYDSLCCKVSDEQLTDEALDTETRIVIEAHDSEYDGLGAYMCADCTPTESCTWHEDNGRKAIKPEEEEV